MEEKNLVTLPDKVADSGVSATYFNNSALIIYI